MLRGVDVNMILRSFCGVYAGGSLGVSSSDGEIGAFLSIIDTSRISGTGVTTRGGLRRVERVEGGLVNLFSDITSGDCKAGDAAEFLRKDKLDDDNEQKGRRTHGQLAVWASSVSRDPRRRGYPPARHDCHQDVFGFAVEGLPSFRDR